MNDIPVPLYTTNKLDQSGSWRNPAGTNPFPNPSDMPSPLWNGSKNPLTFRPSVDDPYTFEAEWTSPLFDLRPNFRGAQSTQNGYPIWLPQGAGGKLFCQVSGLKPVELGPSFYSQTRSLYVVAREYGHVNDSTQIRRIAPEVDITSEFSGSTADDFDRVLQFLPTGGGYPIRYYKVKVVFRYIIAPGNVSLPAVDGFLSPINITATYM